jgi:serine/threonine protein kinase
MLKHATAATTRSVAPVRLPLERSGKLLAPGEVVGSPETLLMYKIERLLGEGGFGQVYLARRLGRSAVVPQIVCIKVSSRIDGWLREAYFGQLLQGHARAIRVFDAFPLMRGDGRVLYCLTLEYARHGDLSAFLSIANKG